MQCVAVQGMWGSLEEIKGSFEQTWGSFADIRVLEDLRALEKKMFCSFEGHPPSVGALKSFLLCVDVSRGF